MWHTIIALDLGGVVTEPSQASIDRAREIGLSFNESQVTDEELRSAIATYERVYVQQMAEKRSGSVESTERRQMFGPASMDEVRNPPA
ncbi:hypothetical protein [Mycobacteroides franklinii]|uniref:hypothetical protein n=1 Tax=Mycobacteroides franklinii TaxID=948102 RepID=UPI0012FF6D8C|nr:hypothetical protein [Mycobacteroides franklinii]